MAALSHALHDKYRLGAVEDGIGGIDLYTIPSVRSFRKGAINGTLSISTDMIDKYSAAFLALTHSIKASPRMLKHAPCAALGEKQDICK